MRNDNAPQRLLSNVARVFSSICACPGMQIRKRRGASCGNLCTTLVPAAQWPSAAALGGPSVCMLATSGWWEASGRPAAAQPTRKTRSTEHEPRAQDACTSPSGNRPWRPWKNATQEDPQTLGRRAHSKSRRRARGPPCRWRGARGGAVPHLRHQRVGQSLPHLGRLQAGFGRHGPTSDQLRKTPAEIGRIRPRLAQIWPIGQSSAESSFT